MRPAAIEAKLLDLAKAAILQKGTHKMRIVDIAALAGISHAAVYRYFPSKALLLEAVCQKWYRDFERELSDIIQQPDPADDKLERLILVIARRFADIRDKEPYLFALIQDCEERGVPVALQHRAALRRIFARVLDDGMQNHIFEVQPIDRAVGLAFDMTFRYAHPCGVIFDKDMPREQLFARLNLIMQILKQCLARPLPV